MKIKELELKLNEFIVKEKLNTLERQDLQYNLIVEIEREVTRLLNAYGKNYYIVAKRNHIVITDNLSYPIENAWIDIVIKYKKGTEHSRYAYTQYYYINKIEVAGKTPDINSTEDVEKKIEENNKKSEKAKQAQIKELKEFMQTKNITINEMNKYTELYKRYKYII